MTFIINQNIKDVYKIFNKKSFIQKIFVLENKECINKDNENKIIKFNRIYSNNDLDKVKSMKIPDDVKSMLNKYLGNIELDFCTTQTIIKNEDNLFVLKYSSILSSPETIVKLIGNMKILLYVVCKQKKDDENMTIIKFYKKITHLEESEIDNMFNHEKDITNDLINEEDDIFINQNIISISNLILGENMVNDYCIPFIKQLYKNGSDLIQKDYEYRLIQYLKNHNILIYKKKQS